MQEDRFRVSVCLKRFYSDERSRAYVSVVPKHQVQWLQERLRSLFSLDGHFCLCSRGHLLPSEEPLSLLQPDDPVEVIPLSSDSSEKKENNLLLNGMACLTQEENVSSNLSIPHITDSKGSASLHDEENVALLKVKQHALELLNQFSGESTLLKVDEIDAPTSAKEAPRRRRRVRRRKRRPSMDEMSIKGEAPAEERDRDILKTDMVENDEHGISVAPRKARLVHSLSHTLS